MTQKERILKLLRQRKSKGVAVYELVTPRPNGLGVSQYNARIYDLRKEGYKIDNKDNRFFLVSEPRDKYKWVFEGNIARKVEM